MAERRCRECGCTDECACVRFDVVLSTCWWLYEDLCCACAPGASPDWIHPTAPTPVPPAGRLVDSVTSEAVAVEAARLPAKLQDLVEILDG